MWHGTLLGMARESLKISLSSHDIGDHPGSSHPRHSGPLRNSPETDRNTEKLRNKQGRDKKISTLVLKSLNIHFWVLNYILKLNLYKNSSRSKLPASLPKQSKHHPLRGILAPDRGGWRATTAWVPRTCSGRPWVLYLGGEGGNEKPRTSEDVSSMYGEVWGSKFNVEISKTNTQQEEVTECKNE